MNEKTSELAGNGVATPPPFKGPEEQEHGPSIEERLAALGLDEDTTRQLAELTKGMDNDALNENLLTTLARGVTHDEDVKNADAAGYLRGRNEKIEAQLHPQPQQEAVTEPVFPRYCRRSVWD